MGNFKKINIFLRRFSACLGIVWLGGRFFPMHISNYIGISVLDDNYVFLCGGFLFIF